MVQGVICIILLVTVSVPASEAFEIDNLIAQMEAAYAGIADYRMQVDMKTRVDDGSLKNKNSSTTSKSYTGFA